MQLTVTNENERTNEQTNERTNMKIELKCAFFLLVPLMCYGAEWPVPKEIKCQSDGTFHCKNTGKYEHPFDSTCTKYFLCNEFEDERVEVELTCPENTFYDPVNENCSTAYKCICDNNNTSTKSTPTSTSTPATKSTLLPSHTTTLSDISTEVTPVTEESITTFTTSPSSNSNCTCTCTTDLYSSTSTTESAASSVTEGPASTISETPASTETIISTSSSITTHFTTEVITVSTENLKYCSVGGNFTCRETGRFSNPNDETCNSYFYCYAFADGRVGQYFYSCSVGLFNPEKQACDNAYVCPCSETSTAESTTQTSTSSVNDTSSTEHTTTSSESVISTTFPSVAPSVTTKVTPVTTENPKYCSVGGNFTCLETGRFPNPNDATCNSYFYCYVYSDGRIGQYFYSCSVGLFNPEKQACDNSYICPCSETSTAESTTQTSTSFVNDTSSTEHTTTSSESVISTTLPSLSPSVTTEVSSVTTENIKYCSVGGNFTCLETGRFPNPNDSTCNSYFYCYVYSDGRVGQYFYSCSVGLFNPEKQACDNAYVCPCSATSTSESAIQTSTSSVNDASSTEHTTTSSESIISTTLPSVAPSVTTEVTPGSTENPKYCSVGGNFTCLETGRFPNPNDATCNSYYYCYVYSDGRVGQYFYSCSVGLFNPEKQACDNAYVCPCASTSKK